MLTPRDVLLITNRYIGVSEGYLGDLRYRSHREFYLEYCDLDFDTDAMPGTTRERFITILTQATPAIQARIIRGVLAKYPPESRSRPERAQLAPELERMAVRLEVGGGPAAPRLASPRDIVVLALADAEVLLRDRGAGSAVDRIHTALHGYLRHECAIAGLDAPEDAGLTKVFSTVVDKHPAFAGLHHADALRKAVRSQAGFIDAINTLRNNASAAHPNNQVLSTPEAEFVVNIAKSILTYLDARIHAAKPPAPQVPPGDDDFPF